MRVLRGMMAAEDGLPRTGPTARTLGARPLRTRPGRHAEGDIPVTEPGGMVSPASGGMSVSPPPAEENLPPFRRPPEHGGTAKNIRLFEVDTDDLPDDLRARRDPENPERHVLIEPAREMTFEEYERALEGTRPLWRRV